MTPLCASIVAPVGFVSKLQVNVSPISGSDAFAGYERARPTKASEGAVEVMEGARLRFSTWTLNETDVV